MLQRLSSTRLLADKRSVSDGGNAMPDKCNSCKHDANGPKNLLQRTNPVSLLVENERYVSTGNGCCIAADIFANCAPVTESPTRHTRSGCSSAVMMLYSSLGLMRCGETETPSASSMKYRCWGISREGREGCASRARCRRRDETETSMFRCISDERVCSLYTSSYLSM